MPRTTCPICGDPNAYPLWIDPTPPEGCPEDESWQEGGPITIKSVAECPYQRRKAAQAADWRKRCPEAFDENGNMKSGGLVKVLSTLPPDSTIVT